MSTYEPPGALLDDTALPVCRHEWRLFFAHDSGMTRDEIFHCAGCGSCKHAVTVDGKLCHGYPRYVARKAPTGDGGALP